MQQNAIIVRDAFKSYGKEQRNILNNLNMTVPHGCIYALLGASGCGKTTLLSCIVGVKKLDQGNIWVLGGKPAEKNSGVPGPRVGYMPQDISLVQEFSTIGALYYFARINGITDDVVDEKYHFFVDLLSLPPKNRLVKEMSGGQQRRVSLAASLLHEPELLVLDEPTVGLDPIVREKIWDFLVKMTKASGTAVVITTHYIEEAKLANRVGLMRDGKLLAETTTDKLLAKFQCSSLEEVFLILSQKQEENRIVGVQEVDNDLVDDKSTMPDFQSDIQQELINHTKNKKRKSKTIFKALMMKNLLQFIRHPGTFLFAIVLPFIQATIFFNAVGGDLKDLVMAVVNYEAGHCNYGNDLGLVNYNSIDDTCDYFNISCRFLKGFEGPYVKKQYYDTLKDATDAMENGEVTSLMHFSLNFSQALQSRRDEPKILSEADIKDGEIHTRLDMSNYVVGYFLQRELFEHCVKVHADIVAECNISRKFAEIPMRFEEPIFGKMNETYTQTLTPGSLILISFYVAGAVSSCVIISDKAEGVWDRSLVQGVTTQAILLSHLLTQFLLVIIQTTTLLCVMIFYFNLPYNENFASTVVILILNGLCGLVYGFAVSILLENYTLVNFFMNGCVYCSVVLCGIIWPLEGMPIILRWPSNLLPTTLPSLSLRSVLAKEFSIIDYEVYIGVLVSIGWILIFSVCCLLGIRNKAT